MTALTTVLTNIDAIFRKELQSYFKSPLYFVIAGFFWVLTALFLLLIAQNIIEQAGQMDAGRQLGQSGSPVDVPNLVLQNFLSVMGSILLFVLPVLSMNLYTEERKRGTLELLATSPITNWSVALGKLFAVVTFVITLIFPVALLELYLLSTAKPALPLQIFWVGHLGLVLLAAAVLSIGMFISSLTDSAIMAAFLTFVVVLLLWIVNALGQALGGVLGDALNQLSLLKHYSTLSQGVLDTPSLALFLSYIFLGLFLTAQSIDLFRLQQS